MTLKSPMADESLGGHGAEASLPDGCLGGPAGEFLRAHRLGHSPHAPPIPSGPREEGPVTHASPLCVTSSLIQPSHTLLSHPFLKLPPSGQQVSVGSERNDFIVRSRRSRKTSPCFTVTVEEGRRMGTHTPSH